MTPPRSALPSPPPALRPLAALLALAAPLLLSAGPALSQQEVEQAKTFFNAGAQLYAAGQFSAAVQAFQQAQRLAPRPALLFSIAQAERRQYFLDNNPDHLRRAIQNYRQYTEQVAQGGRRADAAQALSELEPLAQKLAPGPASSGAQPAPPPPEPMKPRLLVMSTQTRGEVTISVDGKTSPGALFSEEVSPGKHTLKVVAPGYFDDEREVTMEGQPIAIDVTMREKPARVSFVAASGAQVSVDGRLVGSTPLPVPIDVAAGRHLITITRNGDEAFSQELEVEKGDERTVKAELKITTQRKISYGLLGTAAVGIIAGGVFSGLALHQQKVAQGINDSRGTQNITGSDLDRYNSARDARDHLWKPAAGVAFGGSLAALAVGGLLYAFDQPTIGAPNLPERPGKPAAPAKPEPAPMEMSAAPLLAPGLLGASLAGSF